MYRNNNLKFSFKAVVIVAIVCLFITKIDAQQNLYHHFSEIELRIDTNQFLFSKDRIRVEKEWKLPFVYRRTSPVVEFKLYPQSRDSLNSSFILTPSSEYQIIDSLTLTLDGYYRCKVRFKDLTDTDFLTLQLKTSKNQPIFVPLYSYTQTYATIYPGNNELYIGEEKSFEIESNFPENIRINPIWQQLDNYEYRVHRANDKILLSIIPKTIGDQTMNFPIELYRPNLENRRPVYQLENISYDFSVKASRLKFLAFDKKEIIWETKEPKGIELQIDNHPQLALNKTYRLEETDESGSPLIAELYTVRRLSNDKVLCLFRPYNFHRATSGYLYIKDGDDPKFITNINILPEPKINSVSILRRGGSWVNSTQIHPGEVVALRLQGEGLNGANFRFEDLKDISGDTLIRTETVTHYLLRVPIDIRKKSIAIYLGNENTGVSLDIVEYQRPKALDFVSIDYGNGPVPITSIKEPILYDKKMGELTAQFDNLFIDDDFELYGKQYLEIEVRILDEDNKLIEKQVIDDIVVCPGLTSPRSFTFINSSDCLNEPVSINNYLSNKTYDIKNWNKVELIIRHRKDHYDGSGYTKRIEIIKAKYLTFDIDLSVPAGLIIKKAGEPGFPGLSGISLAMLAQFSFYKKGEIQKLWPFKVGAGFLAKNAFNFNPKADRDLGVVILGSVYPTTKNRKFSFPLFFGTGYYLYESKFFFLIGPGVSINF